MKRWIPAALGFLLIPAAVLAQSSVLPWVDFPNTGPGNPLTAAQMTQAMQAKIDLAGYAANIVLGTATAGNIGVLNMPSCSGSSNALTWTSGGGFGCNTISGGGGGGGGFNAITSGTNTSAAMVVGTGASLAPTGSGTVTANSVSAGTVGLSGMANLAANSIIGNNTGSPAVPVALTTSQVKTLLAVAPADLSGLGSGVATALGATVSGTGAICLASGSACAGGGAGLFSGIGSGTNTTAAMVVGSGATMSATGSGTIAATSAPLSGISGLGTGVATALAIATNSSGGPCTYATGCLPASAPNRSVATGGVTILSTDFGGQVNSTDASAQNVTTPSSISAGQTFAFTNQGAGTDTIVNGGVALNGLNFTSVGQYGWFACIGNSGGSADCAGSSGPGGGGSGTVTSVDIIQGTNVTLSGTCNSTTAISCTISSSGGSGSGTIGSPQGRLTLISGSPVMTTDEAAKSTIFYDCYRGNNVPYYTGSADNLDSISSCEVSLTMATSGTGVTNINGVFDIWWVHGGASRICVATNGSGGGWASDTGGSNSARGTGYSQVHNTRGYWTNVNSIANCYNGSTNYGSISADQGTYLGTIYTTAAGQTTVSFQPTPAIGGSNNVVGLWNAYNRVEMNSTTVDSTASLYSYTTTSWRAANNSTSNRITWVDGLQQSSNSAISNWAMEASNGQTGITVDGTGAPTSYCVSAYTNFSASIATWVAKCQISPLLGAHSFQEVEFGSATANFYPGGAILGAGVMSGGFEM